MWQLYLGCSYIHQKVILFKTKRKYILDPANWFVLHHVSDVNHRNANIYPECVHNRDKHLLTEQRMLVYIL